MATIDDRALELIKLALSDERYCYDYSKKWRFLCLRPQEVDELCEKLGLPRPAVHFSPDGKKRNKAAKKAGKKKARKVVEVEADVEDG